MVGYIEPLPEGSSEKFEYANEIVGNAIPPNYLPSCKKGFEEAVNSGALPFVLSLLVPLTRDIRSDSAAPQFYSLKPQCRFNRTSMVPVPVPCNLSWFLLCVVCQGCCVEAWADILPHCWQ